MIIVSDTSPLHYLIQIEATHILRDLFGHVVIPQAVHAEMQRLSKTNFRMPILEVLEELLRGTRKKSDGPQD